jgi:hypothetical protein
VQRPLSHLASGMVSVRTIPLPFICGSVGHHRSLSCWISCDLWQSLQTRGILRNANLVKPGTTLGVVTWLHNLTTAKANLIRKNSVHLRYGPTSQAKLRYRNLVSCCQVEKSYPAEKASPRVRYCSCRKKLRRLELRCRRKLRSRKSPFPFFTYFHDNWLFSARTGYSAPDCSFPDSDFKFPEVIKGASHVIHEPVLVCWQNILNIKSSLRDYAVQVTHLQD